jgi:hypothetical protein
MPISTLTFMPAPGAKPDENNCQQLIAKSQ